MDRCVFDRLVPKYRTEPLIRDYLPQLLIKTRQQRNAFLSTINVASIDKQDPPIAIAIRIGRTTQDFQLVFRVLSRNNA
jgi:hypothetical protein